MKRIIAILAVLLLLAPFAALGEEEGLLVKAYNMELNAQTNTIVYRQASDTYYMLVTADGDILVDESAEYTAINERNKFFIVEKTVPDGIHRKGLIDGVGKLLIPAEYADIDIISDRWQAGVKLTPSNADDKDYTITNYTTGEKNFYRVDTVDVFFDGVKVGTLSRYEYGSGSFTARGAYLCVVDSAKERSFYNSRMEKSPYVPSYSTSSEFDSVNVKGKTVFYHTGSGQQVFVESCTLNPADLEDPYLYDGTYLYDIQGKPLFKVPQPYERIDDFHNGYASVRLKKYGLLSLDGHEVIPPQYDSIGYVEDEPLKYGCISAVLDGKFGFLDAQGNVTCSFVYPENIISNRTTFAFLKNMDGTKTVLSGIAGELPEHYAEVSINSRGCAAFIGENSDGQQTVIDLSGNTLVPYGNFRSLEVSDDASVVLGYYGDRQYEIYRFEPYSAPKDGVRPAAVQTQPAAADETGWTCPNGHTGNTGNFCAECGAPKPEEKPAEEGWTCPNGHTGNTGNFCIECGAPKPEEAAPLTHCSNCNYEFGNSVPKFCPSCGTPTGVQ